MRKNDDITKWSPNVAMQTITHEDVMKIFLKNQLIGNWPLKCGFFARVAAGEWDRLKNQDARMQLSGQVASSGCLPQLHFVRKRQLNVTIAKRQRYLPIATFGSAALSMVVLCRNLPKPERPRRATGEVFP